MLRAVATAAPAVPAQTIAIPSAQAGSLVDQTPAPGQTPVTQTCHVEGLPLGLTTPPLVPLTVPVAAVMPLAPPTPCNRGHSWDGSEARSTKEDAFHTLIRLIVDEPENTVILDVACAVEQLGGNLLAAESLLGFSSDMLRNPALMGEAQRSLTFATILRETAGEEGALFRRTAGFLQSPDTNGMQGDVDMSPSLAPQFEDSNIAPESLAATSDPYMSSSPIRPPREADGTIGGGADRGADARVAANFWAGPPVNNSTTHAAVAISTLLGKRRKVVRDITAAMYADLRTVCPPELPEMLLQRWRVLQANPLSSDTITIFKFSTKGDDLRGQDWCWWLKLASAGILVRDLYCGTPHYNEANAAALSGTPGQFVVKTAWGTLTLMIRAGRVQSQNAERELYRRLRVILPPFDTVGDQLALHKGRLPKAVQAHAGKQAADWSAVGFR